MGRMKVFTFSGISASLLEHNDGAGLRRFAFDLMEASKTSYNYVGMENVDHFRSDINFASILATLDGATTLDGSTALNEEGRKFADRYAKCVSYALAADSKKEDILFFGHSQGCNNFAFTMLRLIEGYPQLLEGRKIRVALFDPKVGAATFRSLFIREEMALTQFLFVQSDGDALGNQAIFASKFIDQFQRGDHWWVRGLDHTSVREWKSYTAKQSFLTREAYFKFKDDCDRKLMKIQQDSGKAGVNTDGMGEFQKYKNKYKMPEAVLCEPLTQFLLTVKFNAKATLAKKFIS
jgi:hypothetical protein